MENEHYTDIFLQKESWAGCGDLSAVTENTFLDYPLIVRGKKGENGVAGAHLSQALERVKSI